MNRRAFWIASTDCVGEGLQQVDGVLGEFAGRLAAHHQRADDLVGAAAAARSAARGSRRADDLVEHVGSRLVAQVGDLDRRALRRRLPDAGVADADVPLA